MSTPTPNVQDELAERLERLPELKKFMEGLDTGKENADRKIIYENIFNGKPIENKTQLKLLKALFKAIEALNYERIQDLIAVGVDLQVYAVVSTAESESATKNKATMLYHFLFHFVRKKFAEVKFLLESDCQNFYKIIKLLMLDGNFSGHQDYTQRPGPGGYYSNYGASNEVTCYRTLGEVTCYDLLEKAKEYLSNDSVSMQAGKMFEEACRLIYRDMALFCVREFSKLFNDGQEHFDIEDELLRKFVLPAQAEATSAKTLLTCPGWVRSTKDWRRVESGFIENVIKPALEIVYKNYRAGIVNVKGGGIACLPAELNYLVDQFDPEHISNLYQQGKDFAVHCASSGAKESSELIKLVRATETVRQSFAEVILRLESLNNFVTSVPSELSLDLELMSENRGCFFRVNSLQVKPAIDSQGVDQKQQNDRLVCYQYRVVRTRPDEEYYDTVNYIQTIHVTVAPSHSHPKTHAVITYLDNDRLPTASETLCVWQFGSGPGVKNALRMIPRKRTWGNDELNATTLISFKQWAKTI